MIKSIKARIYFYKSMLHEVLETLVSICLYLEYDGHHCRNPYARYMGSHATVLKGYAENLRAELAKAGGRNE